MPLESRLQITQDVEILNSWRWGAE